jgi:glutamyl-tRNA reductase
MKVQVVGCSHHDTPIEIRERLAFGSEETRAALQQLRQAYPGMESVLLSTCNRVELYTATENAAVPTREEQARFLAGFHGVNPEEVVGQFYVHEDEDAVRHLFTVTSSLDSMVVGEPQIFAQVKQAYELANRQDCAGPLTHATFQAALKVARRVAGETTIQRRRVSIPSVAVADFAKQIFEHFDDKETLVIGAGEMAEETLQYLRDEGAHDIVVVNRSLERATDLARRWRGRAVPWDQRSAALAGADVIISITGAEEPVVTLQSFLEIEAARQGRPLFILDLAVPRDFDPAIGQRDGVYLYSIDDLREACEQNRRARDKQLPAAQSIINQEIRRFMADMHHRATGPVIRRLRQGWQKPKEEELRRLLNKLPDLDDRARDEISQSFDRLINKLLHPPLESLRSESRHGIPSALLDAIAKLFQLKD